MFCNLSVQPHNPPACFLTTTAGIAKLSSVSQILGGSVAYVPFWKTATAPELRSPVLAWGHKPSASKAQAYARRHGLAVIRLEDGFLRSVGLGHQDPPCSLVVDDLGIYYDATAESRLEHFIAGALTPAESARAAALLQSWQQARVSKYNHNREKDLGFTQPYVLVADQTYGDASVRYGLASGASFRLMLQTAKQQFPEHTIVLKVHPDVMAGKKRGYFRPDDPELLGVHILAEDVHPAGLLAGASAVFCVTSQLGFEALLWQKPVYTFGMPFYAGWGLTIDALEAPSRRKVVPLLQLVFAALVRYPRYLDPETGHSCEVERLMEWLALQRQQQQRFPAELYAVGFSWWKRHLLRGFLRCSRLHFVESPARVPAGQPWLCWGSRFPSAAGQIRLEDGFIRSVGLGVALTRPLSWVFDPVGIYYDSSAPSQLEELLETTEFTESQLAEAADLQQLLLSTQTTKYNLGNRNWRRPPQRQVILVPGQVESDASIQRGSPQIRTNMQLLERVRAQNPTAWLVYKPHPDVQAGLRKAGRDEAMALQFCDEIVLSEDMAHLLTQVDEVHTMTSLTGFEALLRGLPVCCYGQPFYAGWGLTRDLLPLARRRRILTLPQLIAGALLLYPVYLHPQSGRFSTAKAVVQQLCQQRERLQPVPWWRPVLEWYLQRQSF